MASPGSSPLFISEETTDKRLSDVIKQRLCVCLSQRNTSVDMLRIKPHPYLCFLSFRIINALLIRTTYSADEYFQSIEVAHWITFGYGHLPWEWEPCVALRGYLHPYIFALLYKLLALLQLDRHPEVFIHSPRILQAFFAALFDYSVFRLAELIYNNNFNDNDLSANFTTKENVDMATVPAATQMPANKTAMPKADTAISTSDDKSDIASTVSTTTTFASTADCLPSVSVLAAIFSVTSWFNFFVLCRTYSNSCEASLVTAAVYYWCEANASMDSCSGQYDAVSRNASAKMKRESVGNYEFYRNRLSGNSETFYRFVSLFMAAIAAIVRPSSALFFFCFYGLQMVCLLYSCTTRLYQRQNETTDMSASAATTMNKTTLTTTTEMTTVTRRDARTLPATSGDNSNCPIPHMTNNANDSNNARRSGGDIPIWNSKHLFISRSKLCRLLLPFKPVVESLCLAVLCGGIMLSTGLYLDYKFTNCEKLVFPIFNFMKINALSDASGIFGRNSLFFFMFGGTAQVLLTLYPVVIFDILISIFEFVSATLMAKSRFSFSEEIIKIVVSEFPNKVINAHLGLCVLVNIICLSKAAHKEPRFLLPLHGFFILRCAYRVRTIMEGYDYRHTPVMECLYRRIPCMNKRVKVILCGIVIPHLVVGYVATREHRKGGDAVARALLKAIKNDAPKLSQNVDTADYKRTYFSSLRNSGNNVKCPPSIYYIGGCYALPAYSHIHLPIPIGFLDCSPNYNTWTHINPSKANMLEEFYRTPVPTLDKLFGNAASPGNSTLPLNADVYIHPVAEWKFSRKAAWLGGLTSHTKKERCGTLRSKELLLDVVECLDYRFDVPLHASQLPAYFVVRSDALREIEGWLETKGYRENSEMSPIFESYIEEGVATPIVYNTHFHIFEHFCRSG